MEGVEEANRAAVESCKKLVAVLARFGDPFQLVGAAAAAETDEAVSRFGKVVAILSNRVGHARVRLGKRSSSSPPVDPRCLLDHPLAPCHAPGGLHLSTAPAPPPPPSRQGKEAAPPPAAAAALCAAKITPAKFDRSMFLETPLLDLNGCGVPSTATASAGAPAPPPVNSIGTTQIQFQQQQQQQKQKKRVQFDQKQGDKFRIEMAPRSGAGGEEVISFSFDNSVCTSSVATSFFTSISSQLISMSDATNAAAASAAAAPSKKACARKGEDAGGKCHCPKKKKPREKRVVRVPAISDKIADIPADNYSWRKYGQKPIKGSPHPRGYYRCSSKKDCPARKHVERCLSDPAMLIVTYENEHNHAQPLDLSVQAIVEA